MEKEIGKANGTVTEMELERETERMTERVTEKVTQRVTERATERVMKTVAVCLMQSNDAIFRPYKICAFVPQTLQLPVQFKALQKGGAFDEQQNDMLIILLQLFS